MRVLPPLHRPSTSAPATRSLATSVRVQQGDVVKTGADGSVGITMSDNSLLSAGPNSVLALDQYAFDTTTNPSRVDAVPIPRGRGPASETPIIPGSPLPADA